MHTYKYIYYVKNITIIFYQGKNYSCHDDKLQFGSHFDEGHYGCEGCYGGLCWGENGFW